jgi:hypothetical protein
MERHERSFAERLALKASSPKPIIVCLCGSTRFGAEFHAATIRETKAGKMVFSIGIDFKSDTDLLLDGEITPDDKLRMDLLHLHKIDAADEILVLNVGGYIGKSTAGEIIYAYLAGKRVRWLEPPAEASSIKTFPREIAQYGVPYGSVIVSRAQAEERAQQYKGAIIDDRTDLTTDFLRGTAFAPSVVDLARKRSIIADVIFVDDPAVSDGSRGRLYALCEPAPTE